MKKSIQLLIPGVLLLAACSSSKKSDPTPPDPQQATLLSPAQNALCNQGTPQGPGQSSVTFQWGKATAADTYELDIKDLLDGSISTYSTSATELQVTLKQNTPYSWSVISRSDKTAQTATTAPWKFYNSGPGTVDYAPFPAELTAPAFNTSITASAGSISLSWSGADVDGDALSYDLYFGTTPSPPKFKSAISTTTQDVQISSGSTYYWKIVTKDSGGNSSESAVSMFRVN